MPKIYSDLFKKIILDELKETGSISKVAKKYNLNYSVLYRWNKENKNNVDDYKIEELSFFADEISQKNTNNDIDIDKVLAENNLLKSIIINKEIEIANLKLLLSNNSATI